MTEKDKQILAEIDEFERRLSMEAQQSPTKVEPIYTLWRELRTKLLLDLTDRMEAEDKKLRQMSRAAGSDAAARRG